MSKLIALNGNLIALRGNLVKLDARRPFIIEIDTTKGNGFNSFTLPLTNHTTNIDVKVSDGQQFNISNYLDINRTINFASAGVYTIELRGQCGWSFNNTGDCQKLTNIISWGDFLFNYLTGGFYGCINLGLNGGLPLAGSINAPNVTTIERIFNNCNLTFLSKGLLYKCVKLLDATVAFGNNKLTVLDECLFLHNTKLTNVYYAFVTNRLQNFPKKLFWTCLALSNINNAFQNNPLLSIDGESFTYNTNLTSCVATFADCRVNYIGEGLFVNCKNITNYGYLFLRGFGNNMVMPNVMFDLDSLYKVTVFTEMFSTNFVLYAANGTIQDIWNYASITATKTNAFKGQTLLTNYDDIPNEWKGL